MTEHQAAVKIIDTYMQALSAGDHAAVADLYADDARLEDPVGSEAITGKQAILAFYQKATDNKLTCKRTGQVRYANRELVFPFECLVLSDAAKMKIEIIDHFVLNDDGLIVSMRAFWSQENMSVLE